MAQFPSSSEPSKPTPPVASDRTPTATGGSNVDTLVARKEGGQLKIIGNQYGFPGAVSPYMQRRQFITLDQDPGTTSTTPSLLDGNSVYVATVPRSEAEIAALAPLGLWKLEYDLASNPGVVAATQT